MIDIGAILVSILVVIGFMVGMEALEDSARREGGWWRVVFLPLLSTLTVTAFAALVAVALFYLSRR